MAVGDRDGKKTEIDFIVRRNRPVAMFAPLDMKIDLDGQSPGPLLKERRIRYDPTSPESSA